MRARIKHSSSAGQGIVRVLWRPTSIFSQVEPTYDRLVQTAIYVLCARGLSVFSQQHSSEGVLLPIRRSKAAPDQGFKLL